MLGKLWDCQLNLENLNIWNCSTSYHFFSCDYFSSEWIETQLLYSFFRKHATSKPYLIMYCDWLHERARWRYPARLGLSAVSCEKMASFFYNINPLWTKLVQSRRLDVGILLFFCVFMDLSSNSADVMLCWRYALCWLASCYYLLYFLGLDWLWQLSYIF